MRKLVLLGIVLGVCQSPVWAESLAPLAWHATAHGGSERDLALQVLPVWKADDPDTRLDTLAQLQLAAGRYADAERSLADLIAQRLAGPKPLDAAPAIRFELYARAKRLEASDHVTFGDAFARAFREIAPGLDDIVASQVIAGFGSSLEPYGAQPDALRADYAKLLKAQQDNASIALPDAVALLKAYELAESYTAYRPFTDALIAEDDARRYELHDPVLVRTPDGAQVEAMIMLPKKHGTRLPALLGFTIYANEWWSMTELRLTAAHGYAAVVGYSRGKGLSPDRATPYEHDGVDADAVIEWIAKQPWSDGRVGMYGGSYNGFTQWAAAKHRPKALRALMPSVTVAPGIDVPMEGSVSLSFVYSWVPYTTNGKDLDEAHYDDHAHWNDLYRRWYESGRSYRELDALNGAPNPVFQRWLDHPSYDAYWQAMIPSGREFADIDIPVLTTTGYFDGGQIGALYYVQEHHRYNPKAEHYLLIGPWDHVGAQRRAAPVIRGYAIDPVAKQDISRVIRYQWFDYVFRGAPKPSLLADRINYEVMGANVWKHAPTVEAMSTTHRRFYLANDGKSLSLADAPSAQPSNLAVDMARRDDLRPDDAPDPELDDRNGLVFTSAPLPAGTEISGLFGGKLQVITNKRDFDVWIALYEKKADGSYFALSTYLARASYIGDRSTRRLLTPGKPVTLSFTNGRTTSRLFEPGSRLVIVVAAVKESGSIINMGSGKPVSEETAADAGEPLTLSWLPASYLDIPVTVNATTSAPKVSTPTP
jgi:putative CocE/NonD family hydrolase